MQPTSPRLLCTLALAILVSRIGGAHAQAVPQPQELIQAANTASDLSAIGSYRLEASVVVKRDTSAEKKAQLTFFQDQKRSRTELVSGNYHAVDVIVGNKLFTSRDMPPPVPEFQDVNVRGLWHVSLSAQDKPGESFSMELQGVPANCFVVTHEGYSRRYCFDPEKKVLLETALIQPGNPQGEAIEETQLLEYREIEGGQYPGVVRKSTFGDVKVEIEDIQVTRTELDPAVFAQPDDAREIGTCDDMQPPHLTKGEAPAYPQMAKIAHITGIVEFAAVIGENGALRDIRPLSGAPILVQAALYAVSKWRYSPAMCGTDPVPVETHVRVGFHM